MSSETMIDQICKKCGKPFIDDGKATMRLETCKCHEKKDSGTAIVGWICPVCRAGNSPYSMACACRRIVGFY